jgi:hypothetical protein
LYVLERSAPNKSAKGEDDYPPRYNLDAKIIPYGTHKKLNKIFDPPDVGAILTREFEARKGKMVVSGMY